MRRWTTSLFAVLAAVVAAEALAADEVGPGKCGPTEDVAEPVNVDFGRQLFLNDRLVRSRDAVRVWQRPVKYGGNPVLKAETAVEKGSIGGGNAMAAPFSGGVWYDGKDKLFKCYYLAGWANGQAYAISRDGITWERPNIDGRGGNFVFRTKGMSDSSAVILDPDAADGSRWKEFTYDVATGGQVRVSKDGVHWTDPVMTAKVGDRSTIFYNPFAKLWCYSIRNWTREYGRSRSYSESADFIEGAKTMPNRRDWLRNAAGGIAKNGEELYNFDAVAYESVMIGIAGVMNPPQNTYWSMKGLPKMTDLRFGFNADPLKWDGWQFPEVKEHEGFFIPQTRVYGTWDMGYLHSNAAICIVLGDELRFYYTGFAGDITRKNPRQSNGESGMYANATMGFATLRRDGFCSIEKGRLVTKRLVHDKGDRLWLNVDASQGSVVVRARDEAGAEIGMMTVSGKDSTRLEAFPVAAGKVFTLAFEIREGAKLYSFWTSDAKGRSGGYLAGGSPESETLRDE